MSKVEKVQELILDLGWEFDRMSSCGKDTYNELCSMFNIEEMKPL